jgi:predicted kinase
LKPARCAGTFDAIFVDVPIWGAEMEAVILVGVQGSGKSSFYKDRFFSTHVRISLDLLKTRNRENRLLTLCLETQQRFVIDNTNPTCSERDTYITRSKEAGFRVVGYYFRSKVKECLGRNRRRSAAVPDVAILATAKKLEIPILDEGFDELWYVQIGDGRFVVEEWSDEV